MSEIFCANILIRDDPHDSTFLPRSSHDVSCINGILYSFGGENIARTPINSALYSLAPLSEEISPWKQVDIASGSSPQARIAHAQAVVGNQLWIFGGRVGVEMGEGALNDLHYFDSQSMSWVSVTSFSGSAPPARSFHKMVAIGHMLYIFGGCGAVDRLNDFHSFDTETSSWTELPASPSIAGRGGPSLVAYAEGNSIFVATGYSGAENADVHVFDVNTLIWTQLVSNDQNVFRARSVCASCRLHDYMVIFGGEVNTSDKGHEGAGDFTNDIVTICMKTHEIRTHPLNAVSPRGWTAMAAISPSSAVLVGGLSGNDDSPVRLNDTWLIELHLSNMNADV